MQLPSGLVQDVIAKAVRESVRQLAREMRQPVMDIRQMVEGTARELEYGMLIRGTDGVTMTATERLDTREMQISFDFPGFKWTQLIDPRLHESMTGDRRGPHYMQDRPLYYAELPETATRPSRGDDPAYMADIPHKVF